MPAKYAIHTKQVPHRFKPLSRSGVIAWEEGCLKCAVCVKQQCVYGVYQKRGLDPGQMIESIDNECMGCLRCVQNCPKELIHKSLNPEYLAMGDSHWSPDIISRLWYQAETGRIPVSGAGYPGPFSGPGFDSMWTDMSEIVRPTRDGIHGREYISTAVDLGKAPAYLRFTESGEVEGGAPSVLELPLPILLKMPSLGSVSRKTLRGWAMAARRLGTLMAVPMELIHGGLDEFAPSIVPVASTGDFQTLSSGEKHGILELPWAEDWKERVGRLTSSKASALISIRIPMAQGMEDNALRAVEAGVEILHLEASANGRFLDEPNRYMKDGIRSVHLKFVEAGLRDEVTLLVSGGVAMAEHVAKSIICGADAVYVDLPILLALECRMCRRCTKELPCPVEVEKAPSAWVASRVVNLAGAWHNQLLEVMGAMGMRDARRLRGEVGRAMFFEDLDESTFESMGKVEEGCELE